MPNAEGDALLGSVEKAGCPTIHNADTVTYSLQLVVLKSYAGHFAEPYAENLTLQEWR
jgi:hypothetical protein